MDLDENEFWRLGDLHKKDEKYAHDLMCNLNWSKNDKREAL